MTDVNTHIAQAARTIRLLATDAVQAAKSGHPGMPMGMAYGWPIRSGRRS